MYKQGDILLIPIPFTNLHSSKVRPVIVISNDAYNDLTDDILVSAITSNLTDKEYVVPIDNDDLEDGALIKPSVVRVDKIYSLDQSIVKKKIAHSKDTILKSVIIKFEKLCS